MIKTSVKLRLCWNKINDTKQEEEEEERGDGGEGQTQARE